MRRARDEALFCRKAISEPWPHLQPMPIYLRLCIFQPSHFCGLFPEMKHPSHPRLVQPCLMPRPLESSLPSTSGHEG
jgi:hypothetical protein